VPIAVMKTSQAPLGPPLLQLVSTLKAPLPPSHEVAPPVSAVHGAAAALEGRATTVTIAISPARRPSVRSDGGRQVDWLTTPFVGATVSGTRQVCIRNLPYFDVVAREAAKASRA
jgi:hypothetical protein